MKKIVLIFLVLLTLTACRPLSKDEAILKAYALVQQDCSSEYSWHSFPMSLYEARYENKYWRVDVGPNSEFIDVWKSIEGDIIPRFSYIKMRDKRSEGNKEWFRSQYVEHCNPVLPDWMQARE